MSSITLFHNGRPLVRQSILSNRIRIGTGADNDVVLSSSKINERQLTIAMDSSGRWKSSIKGTAKDDTAPRDLRSGKRIDMGEFQVEWTPAKAKNKAVSPVAPEIGMVGESDVMLALRERIGLLAPLSAPVFIEGESGSGKELAATAMHSLSKRATGPFVAVNCGGLSPNMVEDVFFGHERGAFTGASGAHRGVFEQADGGTLFLDEIGELPARHQASVLRVLDNARVSKIGSERQYSVDFRLVAATNRSLSAMVEEGTFRLDLYHRICALGVKMPPLRQRLDDIEVLAVKFIENMQGDVGKKTLSGCALDKLKSHDWPGNCRELKNVLYKAAALCSGDLMRECNIEINRINQLDRIGASDDELVSAVVSAGGNVSAAARMLGMPRTSLRNRLRIVNSPALS